MNINQLDLADAQVLTARNIKIICCDRCCINNKMLRGEKNKGSNNLEKMASTSLRN